MRIAIGLALALCLLGISSAQAPTSPTAPPVTGAKPIAKPVQPRNPATEKKLPVEVTGITVTTGKLRYIFRPLPGSG